MNTNNHCIVYFGRVNFMIYEVYINLKMLLNVIWIGSWDSKKDISWKTGEIRIESRVESVMYQS